ncbi:Ldh family oxidoreductase [Bradyrhizobium sp. SRL28]|nr:Ldh family oxidoreductase [Bradyrhizobium sp. SRL28]
MRESPATAVTDGHCGFGFYVNTKAIALAIEKAKLVYVAACTVSGKAMSDGSPQIPGWRQGRHDRLAAADSGRLPKLEAPFGGREAWLGTNLIFITHPPISRSRFCSTWRRHRRRQARGWRSPRRGNSQGFGDRCRGGRPTTAPPTAKAACYCRSAAPRVRRRSGPQRSWNCMRTADRLWFRGRAERPGEFRLPYGCVQCGSLPPNSRRRTRFRAAPEIGGALGRLIRRLLSAPTRSDICASRSARQTALKSRTRRGRNCAR